VRNRCEKHNIQLVPKDMAGFIPIFFRQSQNVDAILIDDDSLIRDCWQFKAEKTNLNLESFSSAIDFFNVEDAYKRDTPIYLDVSLGHGVRGDEVALSLFSMGFNNIYLVTGYEPETFTHLTFIKGVIGKAPPF